MDLFIKATILISAIYLLLFSLSITTKHVGAAIFYKFVPFIIGMACLFSFLYIVGFIIKF